MSDDNLRPEDEAQELVRQYHEEKNKILRDDPAFADNPVLGHLCDLEAGRLVKAEIDSRQKLTSSPIEVARASVESVRQGIDRAKRGSTAYGESYIEAFRSHSDKIRRRGA